MSASVPLFMILCFPGFKQQKELTSRGCDATLFRKYCYLYGSLADGFTQQPVDYN